MKQYTREEIIAELAQNVDVRFASYGTWRISSYLGSKWRKEEGSLKNIMILTM